MEFKDLGLHPDIMRGVEEAGFVTCTPVQAAVYPHGFAGDDIYAQSQTGTGKTAAFLLSIFQRILTVPEVRTRKVLVLAPTRELAVQIEGEAKKLGKHLDISAAAFYGGVGYGPQVDALRANVQVMIGTPGRIIDLVKQGKMLLRDVGFLVIDEADRMFDMGFIDDLRKLIRYLPPAEDRQTFLFSATLGLRVKDLAWEYMISPKEIVIEPEQVTVDLVTQELYHVGAHEKMSLLLGILDREKPKSAIIFANQKVMVEELARRLKINGIECEYIMGDLPQSKRLEIIERLKAGELSILVATDVAARGLDIKGLDLVINYDLPDDTESYVHRIGRTARAGEAGKAVTLACEKFVFNLPSIEKFIGMKIPVAPFDTALLLPDKSEGMRLRRSIDERGGRRGGSSGGRGRDEGRGRSGRGGGRPDREGPRRAPARYPEDRGRDELPVGDTRREETRRGPKGERGTTRRGPERQPESAGTGEALGANPYALSQDERLKKLKERYVGAENGSGGRGQGTGRGQGAGTGREGGRSRDGGRGQGADSGRGGNRRPEDHRSPAPRGPKDGQRHPDEGSSRPAGQPRPMGKGPQGPERSPRTGGGRPQGASTPRPTPVEAKKPGLIDRLKKLFGKKKPE